MRFDDHKQPTEKSWKKLFFDSVFIMVAGAVGLLICFIALLLMGAVWFVAFPFRLIGAMK